MHLDSRNSRPETKDSTNICLSDALKPHVLESDQNKLGERELNLKLHSDKLCIIILTLVEIEI